MYSFYGGRPGNSFIIITTYRSIADMVAKFKQGPSYTAVHYDEHVMINTVNKNDPDNGRVYRRGYDFTNDMGGAEYIGTIVGPAGKAPMLEMTTVADVRSKHASEGYDERFTSGQYGPTSGNLVPGKTGSGTFNDVITWACCSIRNENDEDATAYIGFTFPYTVIDYETSNVEPYVSGKYADTSSATRVDDESHPFYEKWHINVPKGVKGDAIKNLKVETASSSIQSYDGQADDVNNSRKIIAYDYYNYDDYQNGNPKRFYLGDFNMIDNITINDEGTITIDYSHDNDSVWTKKFKWIKSVSLNDKTGDFKVVYNHATDASGNATEYNVQLKWVDDLSVNDDGTVTISYTKEADKVYNKLIKWVTGITMNGDGTITIKWNNGTADTVFSQMVQWISSISLANNGTLTVKYNNGAADTVFTNTLKWITGVAVNDAGTLTVNYNNGDPAYVAENRIKWINSITMSDTGTLQINYNNGSDPTVFTNMVQWLTGASVADNGTLTFTWNNGTANTVYTNLLRWVSSLSIDTGTTEGEGTQKLKMRWNNMTAAESDIEIGNPINYIMEATVNNENHLLVRYSDPVRRTSGISYNGRSGWTDLGIITHNYEYNVGDNVNGLEWIGVGQLVDSGVANSKKKVRFIISPARMLNPAITRATVTNGTLTGTNGTDNITSLNLSAATVLSTPTGLVFEVKTAIATSGAASTSFINLAVASLALSFIS